MLVLSGAVLLPYEVPIRPIVCSWLKTGAVKLAELKGEISNK